MKIVEDCVGGIYHSNQAFMMRSVLEHRKPLISLSIGNICMGLILFWLICFIFSRIHMFINSYNLLTQELKDEEWLVKKCQDDNFYHNMKRHSEICDQANMRLRDILFISAIKKVVDSTYLCGYEPCAVMLDSILNWMIGKGFLVCVLLGFILLMLPTIILPLWRQYLNSLADKHMNQLYNNPYGTMHYISTHPWTDLQQISNRPHYE